jgi:hypothetical protein
MSGYDIERDSEERCDLDAAPVETARVVAKIQALFERVADRREFLGVVFDAVDDRASQE